MNKMQKQVQEFHEKYGVNVGTYPKLPAPHRCELRAALIREELDEFERAIENGDLVKAVDGLGDLLYVVFGSFVEFGVDAEAVVDEIHKSNLSKLGADGKPIYAENGKVLKGPDYRPPDISKVLFGPEARASTISYSAPLPKCDDPGCAEDAAFSVNKRFTCWRHR